MPAVGDAIPKDAQVGSPIPAGASVGVDPLTQQTQAAARAAGVSTIHPQPSVSDVAKFDPDADRASRERMALSQATFGPPYGAATKEQSDDPARRAGFEQAGIDTAGMLALPGASAALGKIVPAGVSDAIGEALRTPKGTLRPSVKALSRIGGAALGYKLGGPVGGVTGGLMGTSAADALIPEHPNPPGWSVKLPGRMPTVKAERPPASNPFAGLASTSPGDVRALSPLGRIGSAPQGSAPITETPPNVRFVREFEKPQEALGRIVSPDSPPPHVEGSYWSFKEPSLRQAVLSGDRDAAIVYKQRFGALPPGARYVTDVGDRPNRGLYESRR